MPHRFLPVLFVTFCMLIMASSTQALKLLSVEFENGVDQTKIHIDLDRGAAYQVFSVTGPSRIVLDLPALENDQTLLKARLSDQKSGLVRAVRVLKNKAKGQRIIFELTHHVRLYKPQFYPSHARSRLSLILEPTMNDLFETQAFNHQHQVFRPQKQTAHHQTFAHDSSQHTHPHLENEPGWSGVQTRGSQKWTKTTRQASRKPVIILDPGHGGRDSGAISLNGVNEKDLTLTFSNELAALLLETGAYDVYLTRNSDVKIPLRERTALAERVEGDLFISIHADSHTGPAARGASFYTLSEEGATSEVERVYNKALEQARDGATSPTLTRSVTSAQNSYVQALVHGVELRESMQFSRMFAEQLSRAVPKVWPARNKPHKRANFAVLKSSHMPAVLLEMGYLSNEVDEQIMMVPAYRLTLAEGIKSAIDSYFRLIDRDTVAR